MEPNTSSDLTTLVANWRNRAAQEDSIGAQQLAELESHLLDSVDQLREAGLNVEEAFLIASRRLGQPQELAIEYRAADPGLQWRKRLTWMLAGVVLHTFVQWGSFCMQAMMEPFLSRENIGIYLFWRSLTALAALLFIGYLVLRKDAFVLRKLGNRFNGLRWDWALLAISCAPLLIMVGWGVLAVTTNKGMSFNPVFTVPNQLSFPILSIMLIWSWRRTYGTTKSLAVPL